MFPVLEWVCLNQHQTSTAARRRRRALATSPHGQRTSNAEAEVSEKELIYQCAGLNFDARQSSQLTASIRIKKNLSTFFLVGQHKTHFWHLRNCHV